MNEKCNLPRKLDATSSIDAPGRGRLFWGKGEMSPQRASKPVMVPSDPISQRLHFWGEAFRQFGWPPILLFIALYGAVSVARWAEPWLTLTVKTHVEAINTMKDQQMKQTDIMEQISENQRAIVTTLEVQGQILQEIQRAVAKDRKE